MKPQYSRYWILPDSNTDHPYILRRNFHASTPTVVVQVVVVAKSACPTAAIVGCGTPAVTAAIRQPWPFGQAYATIIRRFLEPS